jgi:hypothetical protein
MSGPASGLVQNFPAPQKSPAAAVWEALRQQYNPRDVFSRALGGQTPTLDPVKHITQSEAPFLRAAETAAEMIPGVGPFMGTSKKIGGMKSLWEPLLREQKHFDPTEFADIERTFPQLSKKFAKAYATGDDDIARILSDQMSEMWKARWEHAPVPAYTPREGMRSLSNYADAIATKHFDEIDDIFTYNIKKFGRGKDRGDFAALLELHEELAKMNYNMSEVRAIYEAYLRLRKYKKD